MASTGSTEGYNAENFRAQGSTRWEIGGELDFMANSFERRTASTFPTGSTIPMGALAVTNSSTALSLTLGAAKQGAYTRIVCLNASSSGIHTFTVPSTDYDILGGGEEAGESFSVQNSGIVDIYCPSTSIYVVGGPVVGSSDLTVAGT